MCQYRACMMDALFKNIKNRTEANTFVFRYFRFQWNKYKRLYNGTKQPNLNIKGGIETNHQF